MRILSFSPYSGPYFSCHTDGSFVYFWGICHTSWTWCCRDMAVLAGREIAGGLSEGALAFQNWSECPLNFWRQPFSLPLSLKRREKHSLHQLCFGMDLPFFLLPHPSVISVHISAERKEGRGETTNPQFIKSSIQAYINAQPQTVTDL